MTRITGNLAIDADLPKIAAIAAVNQGLPDTHESPDTHEGEISCYVPLHKATFLLKVS